MSHQQEITCFLGSGTTPAANQEADQLERRAKTGRANKNRRSGHDSPSDPKDPPKRTMLKRKRVTKEVKKRERKRVNKPRKCKTSRENSSTPTQTNITPMPSPEPNNVFNSGVRDSFDSSATINDRSLTDMLASGTCSVQSAALAAENTNDVQSSNRAARLESQITAAALALEHEISEKQSMKNAIDLLNNELDEHKRNQKNLQSEIKRLTCENDKLRRELSRYKGIRKYITGADNRDDQSPKQPESAGVVPVNDTAISEELSVAYQLASLRDHMIHIGNSLIPAVDDDLLTIDDPDNGSFTKVVSRRSRQLRSGDRQPDEEHIPSPTTGGREVQSISVVIGTGRNNSDNYAAACRRNVNTPTGPNTNGSNLRPHQGNQHAYQPTAQLARSDPALPRPRARQPADHQRHDTTPNRSSTIIIGTSLVRGLGSKLSSLGTRSTTFTYPGRDIPYLRSRL